MQKNNIIIDWRVESMYSIILVEDDVTQREILKKMIIPIYEFIEIYEADSESTALHIIENNDINMFLIDIQLKESSGLELAMKIRNIPKYEFRQMIFLTTHVEYIMQAFKQIHCYDYILKPYDINKVCTMISKIILNENNNSKNENNDLDECEEKEIVITLKNGVYVGINISDIIFIEVKGKDCEVNTVNGSFIAYNISLKKVLKSIDCKEIIQSHRAFAINKNYVYKIEKQDPKFKDSVLAEFKKGKVIVC